VISTALSHGATGYTFSTHPANLEILSALKNSPEVKREFDLYPVLPYAEGYVRLANEKGMSGLVKEVLSRLSTSDKAKAVVGGGFSAVRFDLFGMLRAYLDAELRSYLKVRPENSNLRGVLLHEVLTDLCLGLEDTRVLDLFVRHIRDKYKVTPGFVTYNFAKFVKLIRDAALPLSDVMIMTPFNSVGFQMSPSRHSCEACLPNMSEGSVIAMSVLAGGFLKLDQAIDYLRTLPNLSGIAVGVSSKDHAKDTFAKLSALS